MNQRFISGSDIVSTRSWRIAELFDAFFNHDLGCYRPHSVEKEYSGQSCITCAEDRPLFGVPSDSECFYGRSGCGGPYEVNYETILERLVECDFDLEDIEKYEKAHGIWRAACSATDDLFLHLGTSPDDREPSITGEEIIGRWKGSRANLFKALRDGDLVPVDQIPLRGEECTKRHTKELDPCLYCESPSLDKICKLHNEEHKCHHKDDSVRIDRVNISSFLLREVLEYEEKVLASAGDAGPDAPKVYSMPPISSGCIKGEELLTRWRALPFQLVAAWKNGLGTVRAVDGARQVHGRSCLECWGCDSNGFPSCNRNYAYCDRAGCDGCRCLCARGETTGGVDVATLGARLRESSFILEEVEDYERLNLLGPEKKRLEFSPIERKKKVYVQVELGEPFSSKNAPHQPSPYHSHHAAEAPAETLLPTGITETAMPGQDLPDNPLDYGKEMVKMGYKGAERIRRMEERFPYLNTAQVGAYARGLPPGEKNEGACKQWYQRNKPD